LISILPKNAETSTAYKEFAIDERPPICTITPFSLNAIRQHGLDLGEISSLDGLFVFQHSSGIARVIVIVAPAFTRGDPEKFRYVPVVIWPGDAKNAVLVSCTAAQDLMGVKPSAYNRGKKETIFSIS
jgi:hypothetical protein